MESSTEDRPRIRIRTRVACPECGQVFDLFNAYEADQFRYGHDCEA